MSKSRKRRRRSNTQGASAGQGSRIARLSTQPRRTLGLVIWGWTKWTVPAAIAVFGLVASFYGIRGGPPWPSDPEIHPRDPSSLVLPFKVRNTSGLVRMNELVFRCGVDFVYAEDAAGQTVAITGAAFVTGVAPSISPNETAIYTCDASDLLEPRPDGTLSLFGYSTKLAVYGSDQPILWKPPFHVLKMCVWIGGEYRWAWRKWSLTSQIFQWPASPSSLQWIEGPVVMLAAKPIHLVG